VDDQGIGNQRTMAAPRYGFRTHAGIRTVRELLGHSDVATTMLYTHVLKLGGGGAVRNPVDSMSVI
jgi:integrase